MPALGIRPRVGRVGIYRGDVERRLSPDSLDMAVDADGERADELIGVSANRSEPVLITLVDIRSRPTLPLVCVRRIAEVPEASQEIEVGDFPNLIGVMDQRSTHELGVDFLKTGSPDAVAAMFEVHAFVVDAAREKINGVSGDAGRGASAMPTVATLRTGKDIQIKA